MSERSAEQTGLAMTKCACCNGNLLLADRFCDWCRAGACTSAPCTGHAARFGVGDSPRGETAVEWNVLDNGVPYLQPWTEDEYDARSYSNVVTGPLVRRSRVRFDDIVGQWHSVANTLSTPPESRAT